MPKSEHGKPRTKVKNIPSKTKGLNQRQQKKVKGGLLPYIEQDNLHKSRAKASLADEESLAYVQRRELSGLFLVIEPDAEAPANQVSLVPIGQGYPCS